MRGRAQPYSGGEDHYERDEASLGPGQPTALVGLRGDDGYGSSSPESPPAATALPASSTSTQLPLTGRDELRAGARVAAPHNIVRDSDRSRTGVHQPPSCRTVGQARTAHRRPGGISPTPPTKTAPTDTRHHHQPQRD